MIPAPDTGVLATGAPDEVDLLGRQLLRHAAACTDTAARAETDPPARWSGQASDAFATAHGAALAMLRAAADDAALAGRALLTFSDVLRRTQQQRRQAQSLLDEAARASAGWLTLPDLHRTGPDPGDGVRCRAYALLDDAAAIVDAAATTTASLLDNLLTTSPLGAGRRGIASRVLSGAGEATRAMAEMVWNCGVPAVFNPPSLLHCASNVGHGIVEGGQHPVAFGKAVLDWDTWQADPARAVGHLLPDAALVAATGGAARLAQAAETKAAAVPLSLRTGRHRLGDINGAPGGPHYDNCPSCAIATDLTLAGFPASAIPDRPMVLRDLAARYDSMFVIADRDWITEQLLAGPPGSRGIVFGMRDGREGHVFNAVHEDGRVYFIDGQTGDPAVFQDSYIKLFFLRTDGLTPLGAVDKEAP